MLACPGDVSGARFARVHSIRRIRRSGAGTSLRLCVLPTASSRSSERPVLTLSAGVLGHRALRSLVSMDDPRRGASVLLNLLAPDFDDLRVKLIAHSKHPPVSTTRTASHTWRASATTHADNSCSIVEREMRARTPAVRASIPPRSRCWPAVRL